MASVPPESPVPPLGVAGGKAVATIALTGSASGIGAATRDALDGDGHRVIGVDLHDAEVVADLGTKDGRAVAIEGVLSASDGVLDGYAGFAGVPATVQPPSLLASVSYFGSVAMLEGLRPALARGTSGSAIAVSSCAATVAPVDDELVAALLDGDESRAVHLATHGGEAYASAKLALARWVRRHAPEWAADGVRLNALAPGNTHTPLTQAALEDPEIGPLMRAIPVPVGEWAQPPAIAAAAVWLLSPAASFVVGSVLFVDGGTDALVRPDTF
jgi:NAD(P)-dependent dehydrogenase (short-subunit alcohol dehydrogenase family)